MSDDPYEYESVPPKVVRTLEPAREIERLTATAADKEKLLQIACDEVERLKAQNADLRRWKAMDKPLTAAMKVVSNDMQRLRAETERLKTELAEEREAWHGMSAEVEQLRTALAEITKLPAVDGFCDIEAVRRGQELRLNEQARAIARRALEGK